MPLPGHTGITASIWQEQNRLHPAGTALLPPSLLTGSIVAGAGFIPLLLKQTSSSQARFAGNEVCKLQLDGKVTAQ